ncbi:zinc ribbon domain-containing protein [Halalkalibacter okhensis]|uniref:zinc ribbon domain-containing protein n=1 Tax=Halalkalibacter okhensis TaxID=333138 RepID=UPI001F193792|nr:zinc ribbon domain-containing protein [Halalkalibacter okhensis]
MKEEIWDEVNKNREVRAEASAFFREKPALKTGVTMLKDLIYCNECGKKMTIRKDNKLKLFTIKKCEYVNDRGEKCSNAGVKLEHVERNVMLHLKKYRVKLKQTLESLNTQEDLITEEGHKDRLKRIEEEIKKVEEKKCHLIDLALTGIFTHAELKEKRQELMDNLAYLKEQHENLLTEVNNRKSEDMHEQLEGTLSKIKTIEESKNHPEELNQALKLIIKKVYYSRVLPKNIAVKSTRSEIRKNYPYELKIEFY